MRCRFVTPEIVRVPLSDGDFIDLKKTLNAGEYRGILAGTVKDMILGERTVLDPRLVGLTMILAYLFGWSFLDHEGQPVPVSESAILALDIATYTEIEAAVEAHHDANEAVQAALKKTPVTGNGSPSTSPSPG